MVDLCELNTHDASSAHGAPLHADEPEWHCETGASAVVEGATGKGGRSSMISRFQNLRSAQQMCTFYFQVSMIT